VKRTKRSEGAAASMTELVVSITRVPSMTEGAFRAKVVDELNNIGFQQSVIDAVVSYSASRVFVGDTLVYKFPDTAFNKSPNHEGTLPRHNQVPYVARLALCLFVARQNQAPTLGDLEEKLNQIWIPTCGPRVGRLVCIWHAVWSVGAMIRIGAMAAIVDWITRLLGR
jgi:hypothetical protein